MIKLNAETIISLAEAARRVPSNHRGKPPHLSTLIRWIQTGSRGIRLEALRVGGRWVTSVEALQRFAERLTEAIVPTLADDAPVSLARSRHRAAELADEELSRLGL
jgi:hypothetical protein